MHYKFHEPHPAITNLVMNKHGEGKDNKLCYPGDQFYLPMKDALNLQIRYFRILPKIESAVAPHYSKSRERLNKIMNTISLVK